jgi:hypothetical protein
MLGQLKDIKGVIYVFDWGTLFFVLFLLLVLVAAAYLTFKRWQKRRLAQAKLKKAQLVPARQFNELALEALGRIDPVEYFEKKQIKEFYFEITEIVRQFLADNYHVDTLDKTSLEIIEEIERVERDFNKVKELDRYFSECDLVKFAKLRPGLAEMKQKKAGSEKIIKEYFRGK